jgi:hypothetical protein
MVARATCRDTAGFKMASLRGNLEETLPADLVIAVTRRLPASGTLFRDLGSRIPTTVIGDALLPRDAAAAIREGQQVSDAIA